MGGCSTIKGTGRLPHLTGVILAGGARSSESGRPKEGHVASRWHPLCWTRIAFRVWSRRTSATMPDADLRSVGLGFIGKV